MSQPDILLEKEILEQLLIRVANVSHLKRREKAFYKAGEQYNGIVMNLIQGYDEKLQGIQYFDKVNYDGGIFGV